MAERHNSPQDENPEGFSKIMKKRRADDDYRSIPTVKSSIPQIDGKLRIFIGKGDRVVQKFDKERPNVFVAAEDIPVPDGGKALILEAGDGALGLTMAVVHSSSEFFLYDSIISNRTLEERNLEANFGLRVDAHVIDEQGLDALESADKLDLVIYNPQSSGGALVSLDLIRANVIRGAAFLRQGGRLYLVTKTKTGASSHGKILEEVFGRPAETVGRGKGGFRVLTASKTPNLNTEATGTLRKEITFNICEKSFKLETESSLFSKEGLDLGTRILLENVNLASFERLLDLGCGWGAIGIVAATVNQEGEVVMVDVNSRATKVAANNVRRLGLQDRVTVVTSDNLRTDISGNFDLTLSNPPFHADTQELLSLFGQVRDKLVKKGHFYIVVEKTYKTKLEDVMRNSFGNVGIHHPEDHSFWILFSRK